MKSLEDVEYLWEAIEAEKAAQDNAMTFEGWLEQNQRYRITWESRKTGRMVEILGPRGLSEELTEEWVTERIETPATEEEMRKRYEEEMQMRIWRAKKAREDAEKQIIADNDKALDAFRSTHKEVW